MPTTQEGKAEWMWRQDMQKMNAMQNAQMSQYGTFAQLRQNTQAKAQQKQWLDAKDKGFANAGRLLPMGGMGGGGMGGMGGMGMPLQQMGGMGGMGGSFGQGQMGGGQFGQAGAAAGPGIPPLAPIMVLPFIMLLPFSMFMLPFIMGAPMPCIMPCISFGMPIICCWASDGPGSGWATGSRGMVGVRRMSLCGSWSCSAGSNGVAGTSCGLW